MSNKAYYITTPIYYVNDVPHVGNAYTTIMCDALARYKRLFGEEAYMLTGTDENAPKVAAAAKDKGMEPQPYVDMLAGQFKETWAGLNIEFSDFIRTTEKRHKDVVSYIFERLLQQGDIYKGSYEGWYCVPCETFWLESDLKDGKCPNPECGRPVEWVQEDNYYFRLSAYSDKLLDYIEKHPDFLQPEFRKNEVVSFIKQGLRDVSITRSNQGWGIEVPSDPSKVIYVWFDALINYISAAGYRSDDEMFAKLWPAQFQAMGKDIFVRFHCTFWPAMLMALDLPLPDTLFGHGFWTINGEKISKSKGNAISPRKLAEDLAEESGANSEIALDAVRYYLAREVPFGHDGDFSLAGFKNRFNSDLANDLGNLLNRTLSMLVKYFDGVMPDPGDKADQLSQVISETAKSAKKYGDCFDFSRSLETTWHMISTGNKYVNDSKPWELSKQGKMDELAGVLYSAVQAIWAAAVMISPFMPNSAKEIARQLGLDNPEFKWTSIESKMPVTPGTKINGPQPIFPRLQNKSKEDKKVEEAPKAQPETPVKVEDTIDYEHFSKIKLRVAEVIAAEKVDGADKLLKLQVNLGDEQRQIVAGIAKSYSPEELVGKRIILLANLEPAKIRGVVSNGMLLAADGDGKAVLLTTDAPVAPGAKIK